MQITGLPALEIEGPLPKRRPFGLFAHINWLSDTDILGVLKDRPVGTASDPAASIDSDSDKADVATGFNGSPTRWESGVYTQPPGLVFAEPAGGDDDLVPTGFELKNSSWDTPKVTNQGLGTRDAFQACTLIWREKRSTGEMTEDMQVARARELMDLMAPLYFERWMYQQLLDDDGLFNLTVAGDSDSTLYPSMPGALALLEASWTEPGVPTLHAPFFSYPFMAPERMLIDGEGAGGETGKFTVGGTPMILATGHPNLIPVVSDDPTTPADGCIPIYMTGPVFGFCSSPEGNVAEDHLDVSYSNYGGFTNDRTVMLERTFVVGWNSYRALVACGDPKSII